MRIVDESVYRRCGTASGEGGVYRPGPDGLSSVGGYPGNDDKGRERNSRLIQPN